MGVVYDVVQNSGLGVARGVDIITSNFHVGKKRFLSSLFFSDHFFGLAEWATLGRTAVSPNPLQKLSVILRSRDDDDVYAPMLFDGILVRYTLYAFRTYCIGY